MANAASRVGELTAEVGYKSVSGKRAGRDILRAAAAQVSKGFRNLVVIAAFLALWEIAPRTGIVDGTFFPPLSTVLDAWWQLLLSGDLAAHTEASLTRSLGGFLLALFISVPIGLAIGWWKPVAAYLSPLLEVMRNTAPLAILPVFILLLGLGETSKISIVFYACFFPLLLNTISGVKNVDPLLIKSAKSMGLSSIALFRKVIVPAAVPTIFIGIRQSGAASILVLVAAEMVGAKSGLGYLIQYTQFSFQIPEMYAGIITISVIGLILNYAILYIERKLTAWKQNYGE
ncbi:ABC transporter permease [Paenibacillus silvisoli]|uniref:ABC transporter permease n=1 Tax=Paenibacillus silvisoli TaxID=3110539 RepID=UPI002805DA92|nr:ABC transporter permease [Paenibacillus silvisoli]